MFDEDREEIPPEQESAADAEETPAPEAEETPAADAEETPVPETEETPAPEADEAPAPEADEAPAADAEETPAPETEQAPPAEEPPAPEAGEGEPQERPKRGKAKKERTEEPEAIPGAHLEPDLVLDEAAERGSVGERTAAEIQAAEEALADEDRPAGDEPAEAETPQPVATTVLDLAADARYRATGKRKSAVARVTLRPGTGVYTVNGRELNQFFPRPTLQRTARGPLETVGHEDRMDIVAKIHGGGVSSQAGALRHGIARALVEADPSLRGELKRRGFLTRDPRVKERKKAGLKKARKRPQFSKR
jgi:small subunit ribosomal protein S9